MIDSRCDSELMIDYLLASSVARYFGLNPRYFQDIHKRNKSILHHDVVIDKQCNLLFVKLPKHIMQMIKDGYTAIKLDSSIDTTEIDYTFNLTDCTQIGFWK